MQSNSNHPAISVLLPVYNGGDYLMQSVQSVLDQQYENFELLIIDDVSTDGSREWLLTLSDPRIRLFLNNQNMGLFPNLNLMADEARSPLLKLWAQDDRMKQGCLGEFVAFHQSHSQCGYSYCKRDLINEKGEVITQEVQDDTPVIIDHLLHTRLTYRTGSLPGNISNVCMVKSAWMATGKFNTAMKISADLDMWVRLAAQYPTGFLKMPLVEIRDHKEQLSRKQHSYVLHVEEDLEIYSRINENASPAERRAGMRILRKRKLMFYYSLFVKSLISGKFYYASRYLRALSAFDNILLLSIYFPIYQIRRAGKRKP